ncbi:MAG: UDP-glucose 4-epimerase GalE [Mycobacterium sp.]|nr:UDP-glucose 4-epimerase GalE [Mycobacterium sp.]
MRILVTGGAGYIGAHVIRALEQSGHTVAALDDLSTGSRSRLSPGIALFVGSLLDEAFVESSLRAHSAEAVVHIAAKKAVEESVADPLYYYRENLVGMHRVLSAMVATGTPRILFSSSAAVYGVVSESPVIETSPTAPSSPYGWTKLMCEQMIRDVAAAHGISWSALRYFNVAGTAEPKMADRGENNLIPKVFRAITSGVRPKVFGDTYPTPDGTCIRDYIHVEDLADAHIKALEWLEKDGESLLLNCGYGHGYSVREVIDSVERVSGVTLDVREQPRRAGDPAALIARGDKVRETLGWQPKHDDLDTIVAHALAWERKLATKLV